MAFIAAGQWQDAEAYWPVFANGRPALAWELLRRDPRYREETAGLSREAAFVRASNPACLARWGLHFPV